MKIQQIYTEKFMKDFPKPHYLLSKEVEDWDDYDWKNFQSIIKKLVVFRR